MLSVEGGTHRQRVANTVLSERCLGLPLLQKGDQRTTLTIHPHPLLGLNMCNVTLMFVGPCIIVITEE